MTQIRLRVIRFFAKISLKFGKGFFLSSRFIQTSRKIADKALENSLPNDEIYEIQGFKIKRGKSMRYLILTGEYEPAETDFIKKYVKPGMLVFDLGANIGWFTMILSKLVGNSGHVYSFEPDPDYFQTLKENVQLNHLTNVSLFQMGVSNTSGVGNFSLNKEFGTLVIDSKQKKDSLQIEITTLDDFCKKNQIKIDFIKIDVEGSEILVFDGMKESVKNNPGMKFITEFHPNAIRGVGFSPESFFEKIRQMEFKIIICAVGLRTNHYTTDGEIKEIDVQKLLKLEGITGSASLFCYKTLP